METQIAQRIEQLHTLETNFKSEKEQMMKRITKLGEENACV
jgi:hypothetical protein